jgi:hypothetical protein
MAEFCHEFVGSCSAEQSRKSNEENLTEVVEGVFTIVWSGDGGKGVEVGGEAAGIICLVGIARRSSDMNRLVAASRFLSRPQNVMFLT